MELRQRRTHLLLRRTVQTKYSAPDVDFVEMTDISLTECTVLGLSAHTDYEFQVIAVNSIGRGLPSRSVDITTGELGEFDA